uniref:Uncharacterized protein n=1 Tax=Arundo donax TaxID=35708 RepID=A0A0A9DA33_ARUDO
MLCVTELDKLKILCFLPHDIFLHCRAKWCVEHVAVVVPFILLQTVLVVMHMSIGTTFFVCTLFSLPLYFHLLST